MLTILAYFVGDLGIFQNAGARTEQNKRNIIATLSDAVLTAIVIYFMAQNFAENNDNILTAAIISAVVIGLGEWFFHKYIDRHVFDRSEAASDAHRDY